MYKDAVLPSKPYIPETLFVLACCLGSVNCLLWVRFSLPAVACVLMIAVISTAALCWQRAKSKRYTLLCVSMVLASVLSVCIQQQQVLETAQLLQDVSVSACEYELVSDSTQTRFGWKARAQCRYSASNKQAPYLRAQVWLSSKESLQYGELIRIVGRYKENSDDLQGQQNAARGICGTVTVLQIKQTTHLPGVQGFVLACREKLLCRIDPLLSPSRALLAGCICGYKTGLSQFGISQSLASCGLAHMVAVSGAHLSIVASILSVFVARTRFKPALRFGIVACVAGAFVVLCGCPASAIRVWLMSIVGQTSVLFGRRSYALSSSCLCGIGMLIVDPFLGMDVGFLLSLSSVIGLCLFSSYGSYVAKLLTPQLPLPSSPVVHRAVRLIQPLQKSLRSSAITCCVAMICTFPLTSQVFGRLPLVGPLSNCVLGPIFVFFILFGCSAAPFLFIPLVGSALLTALDVIGTLILELSGRFSQLPLACIELDLGWLMSIAIGVLLVFVALVWPRLSACVIRRIACLLTVLLVLWFVRVRYFAPPRMVVLDVGQGDAIVLQDGPYAFLVDTGPKGAIVKALGHKQVVHLDGVLLTHLHDDHAGGVEDLAHTFHAQQVLVAQGTKQSISSELGRAIQTMTGIDAQELVYGSVIQIGRFSVRCVWPRKPSDGTHNADSVMLLCSYQDGSSAQTSVTFLLTGDAEKDELKAVMQAHDVGKIDVLKVGHHGSQESLTQEQAQVLAPSYSLISVGAHNKYGHPTQACVDALEQAGSQVLCTKDYGDLELRPDKRGGFAIMGTRKGGSDG